jgi:hypothetical protein
LRKARIGGNAFGHTVGQSQRGVDCVHADAARPVGGGEAGGGQHQRGIGSTARKMGRRGDLAAHADDSEGVSAKVRASGGLWPILAPAGRDARQSSAGRERRRFGVFE